MDACIASFTRPFQKSKIVRSDESYTYLFLPFFRFLQHSGLAPIHANAEITSSPVVVNFKRFSTTGVIVLTASFQLFWTLVIVTYLSNVEFNYDFPIRFFQLDGKNQKRYQQLAPTGILAPPIFLSFSLSLLVIGLAQFANAWLNAGNFSNLLNNWNIFFNEMLSLRDDHLRDERQKIYLQHMASFQRRLLILIFLLFGTTILSSAFVAFYRNGWSLDLSWNLLLEVAKKLLLAWCAPTFFCLEDLKLMSLFKMAENAFDQVIEILIGCPMEYQSSDLTQTKLQKLAALTDLIRSQCFLTNKLITAPMLLFLGSTLYYGTGAVFLVAKTLLHFGKTGNLIPAGIFPLWLAVWNMIRLLVVIRGASNIIAKETTLARTLANLGNGLNGEARVEARNLREIIIQQPTEICVGGCVTLNNKLILGVLSQILTQTIVLFQFDIA